MLVYFHKFSQCGRKGSVSIFLNGLGYHMPCGSLNGAWEIGTHSRARGGCHVPAFPGRGVTDSFDFQLVFGPNHIFKERIEEVGFYKVVADLTPELCI